MMWTGANGNTSRPCPRVPRAVTPTTQSWRTRDEREHPNLVLLAVVADFCSRGVR